MIPPPTTNPHTTSNSTPAFLSLLIFFAVLVIIIIASPLHSLRCSRRRACLQLEQAYQLKYAVGVHHRTGKVVPAGHEHRQGVGGSTRDAVFSPRSEEQAAIEVLFLLRRA